MAHQMHQFSSFLTPAALSRSPSQNFPIVPAPNPYFLPPLSTAGSTIVPTFMLAGNQVQIPAGSPVQTNTSTAGSPGQTNTLTVGNPVQMLAGSPVQIPAGSPVQTNLGAMHCMACSSHWLTKGSGKRLPSCKNCHHFLGAQCHKNNGLCSLPRCDDLDLCPSSHEEIHRQQEAEKAREMKKDLVFSSKNLSGETKESSKVHSSIALNSFLQMISDTQPERVENARHQAKKWHDSIAEKPKEEQSPSSSKKRKVIEIQEDDDDPYNLTAEAIQAKIREEIRVEESARARRETLEFMLSRCKKANGNQ